jgi:hypothetical protein
VVSLCVFVRYFITVQFIGSVLDVIRFFKDLLSLVIWDSSPPIVNQNLLLKLLTMVEERCLISPEVLSQNAINDNYSFDIFATYNKTISNDHKIMLWLEIPSIKRIRQWVKCYWF